MAVFEATCISMQLNGGRWLFKEVCLELEKGDTLVLRGPSGAGKTTLLKCLAELVPYSTGQITLNGMSPLHFGIPSWRSRVMYVPQRPAIHPGTPMDLFNMAKKYISQKEKRFDDPIKIGIEWNLSESHFYENWNYLSGGEMQRVSLAIALALNPEVLLLDEPTSALDPESTFLVEKTLKGKTCIWITHSPQQESRVATKSLVLPRLSTNANESDDESDGTATEISLSIH